MGGQEHKEVKCVLSKTGQPTHLSLRTRNPGLFQLSYPTLELRTIQYPVESSPWKKKKKKSTRKGYAVLRDYVLTLNVVDFPESSQESLAGILWQVLNSKAHESTILLGSLKQWKMMLMTEPYQEWMISFSSVLLIHGQEPSIRMFIVPGSSYKNFQVHII